jgi:molybdopterin/thiamine biosynthesis adenylyltransferase
MYDIWLRLRTSCLLANDSQVIHSEATLAQPKAISARDACRRLNSSIKYYSQFLFADIHFSHDYVRATRVVLKHM